SYLIPKTEPARFWGSGAACGSAAESAGERTWRRDFLADSMQEVSVQGMRIPIDIFRVLVKTKRLIATT
ncbi:MAG: hypothetical protein WAO69_03775, partial [Aestuariivita sp.]|uniref:hypothetical protein n=1 Tax=Aestuariivita sp. TaxID=1872407 RepID=UPI003BB1EDFB